MPFPESAIMPYKSDQGNSDENLRLVNVNSPLRSPSSLQRSVSFTGNSFSKRISHKLSKLNFHRTLNSGGNKSKAMYEASAEDDVTDRMTEYKQSNNSLEAHCDQSS